MQIEEIKYTRDSYGYPFLEFKADGHPIRLLAEELKRPLLERGYVPLGEEYPGSRRIEIPAEGPYNDVVMSAGVQDFAVSRVCLTFLDDLLAGHETPS